MKIAGKEAPDDSKLILAALKAAKDANKKFKVASTACACLFTLKTIGMHVQKEATNMLKLSYIE